GVAFAGGEIGERHLVSTGDFGVQVMDFACESIRWKPFGECVRIKESPVNPLRRCPEHSMEPDGVGVVCWHNFVCVLVFITMTSGTADSGHSLHGNES